MWIFYSNFILQENTAKAKISAKIRINQFTAELKSQLKIRVTTGSLVVSQFKVTTSPNSCFEEEIEVLKRVKSLLKERSCDNGNVVGTKKGNIQMKKLMSRHQLNTTEVATSLRCCDVDPSMKATQEVFARKQSCN